MSNQKTQQFSKFFLKDLKLKIIKSNFKNSETNNLSYTSS